MMKLGNISPLTLFFFFQLVLSIPGLLCFHTHLKNSLLISTKTWCKLLTSIVSSLHSQTLSHFHTIHFYICYNFPLSIWLFLRDLNNKKRTFIFTQVVTIFCVLPCWSRFPLVSSSFYLMDWLPLIFLSLLVSRWLILSAFLFLKKSICHLHFSNIFFVG